MLAKGLETCLESRSRIDRGIEPFHDCRHYFRCGDAIEAPCLPNIELVCDLSAFYCLSRFQVQVTVQLISEGFCCALQEGRRGVGSADGELLDAVLAPT